MASQRYRRSETVMFEVAGERAVLLTGAGDEMVTLNLVGTLVWLALETPASVSDIAASLSGQLAGVPSEQLEVDIDTFMRELIDSELIVADADG